MVGGPTIAVEVSTVEVSTAGDFTAEDFTAAPLVEGSAWEGIQQPSLIFPEHPGSLVDSDLKMSLCRRAAAME